MLVDMPANEIEEVEDTQQQRPKFYHPTYGATRFPERSEKLTKIYFEFVKDTEFTLFKEKLNVLKIK